MAVRTPLVLDNGQVRQLPVGDTLVGADPMQNSYAPGTFALATGKFAIIARRLDGLGVRVTGFGTARLRGI